MSMNFFLKSFSAEQIAAMTNDHALIDAWILEDKNYSDSIDIETAWDVLSQILSGAGFASDAEVDDVLFNGCSILSPALVKTQVKELLGWTEERVVKALDAIDPDADLYHLDIWHGEDGQDDLIEHFVQFRDFFLNASRNDWGIVTYLA